MRRCVGYIRTSTERQAGEDRTSPADQRAGIERLAAALGVEVQQWYQDAASGATLAKRAALRAMLADCEAAPQKMNAPGYVLVFNDSRWGRFPDPDQAAALRYRFKEAGWLVRLVEGDEVEDVNFRHILRAIGGVQASQHRQAIRGNAKRGSRGTAALGYWGSRTPYGYRRKVVYPPGRERVLEAAQRKAPDEKVSLVPHEAEAAIVARAFQRYATGTETLATLTEWLRREAPERKWTRAAVRFTLSNPAYVGDVVSGRVPGDKDERAVTPTRPESEWVTHRDAHPAIVARALFNQVQDLLARNKQWTKRVRGTWLLSGLVKCPCGRPLVAGGGGRWTDEGGELHRTYSYRCVTKSGIASDRCPYACSVLKTWLESAVIETLASVVGAPAHRRRLLAHLDAALADLRQAPDRSRAAVEEKIAAATAERDRLVSAVADGTLTGEEARTRLTSVRRTIARLETQRDALTHDQTSQRALDAERARLAAQAVDFREAVHELTGPALREKIRPWIADAWFDPSTRTLTLDIRHIPATPHGVLPDGDTMARTAIGAGRHGLPRKTLPATERVTRRRVVVGGAR